MATVTLYPLLVFLLFFVGLAGAAWLGVIFSKMHPVPEDDLTDFSLIISATLTLLGLIIGFSFSMAVGRYDQRKNLEEAEANAIGTEYVRADLLPAADAAKVRTLLLDYTDQRIAYYTVTNEDQLGEINTKTAKLQGDLWTAVAVPAVANPTQINALVVAGMNDVLNSQGYTQAAWWNRIPPAAWSLMAAIAVFSNVMVGIGGTRNKAHASFLWVLPLVVSVAFFLISDLDSPRHGMITVVPQNLVSLVESIRPH